MLMLKENWLMYKKCMMKLIKNTSKNKSSTQKSKGFYRL